MHQFNRGGLMSVQRLSCALWCPLALLTVSVVVNYVARGTLTTGALTTSQLKILLSSFFWAYAAFTVVAEWLAARWDVNWVLAARFFAWYAGTVRTGFAHGFASDLWKATAESA
jgi:hypothetical protein